MGGSFFIIFEMKKYRLILTIAQGRKLYIGSRSFYVEQLTDTIVEHLISSNKALEGTIFEKVEEPTKKEATDKPKKEIN